MLKQRVISAVIAIVLLGLAVYFLPAAELRWIVLAVWTLGAWEWSGFVKGFSAPKRILFSFVAFIPMLAIALNYVPLEIIRWVLFIGVFFWVLSFVQILRFPTEFSSLAILLSGLFVIVPSFAAFCYLLNVDNGLLYVVILLLMIWAADVGAYFSGKALGKNKLAPKVSPGKTREGAYGGLILSLLVAVVAAKY